MKNALFAFLFVLMIAPAVAGAAKRIQNMVDVPVPIRVDGTSFAIEEVQAVIIEGCYARGWSATVIGDGMIRAEITVRERHHAEVDIPFTETEYSIIYASSTGLDYKEKNQKIHRNYNNWVVKLSGTIDKLFRKPAPAPGSTEPQATDVYAEILKLDELRNRGLLTDEEFEIEKQKLLSQD